MDFCSNMWHKLYLYPISGTYVVLRKESFYSLILSAILLLQMAAITTIFSPQNAAANHFVLQSGPEHRGKFIAYADNVEVKGTVIYAEGDLFIVPDKNYENLLTKGNYQYPTVYCARFNNFGNCAEARQHNGYQWYQANIVANLPAAGFPKDSHPPILKMELYGYCERIGSAECYPSGYCEPSGPECEAAYRTYNDAQRNWIPTVVIDENGNERPLKPGDRIRVVANVPIPDVLRDNGDDGEPSTLTGGVYALDNAHSWYYHLCDFPSARMENGLKICFNHAEFHPYDAYSIQLLKPPKPGEPNVESHVVVAPIYEEFYSGTYFANAVRGYACSSGSDIWEKPPGSLVKPNPCDYTKLVDSSLKSDITSEFFIEAPPKPAECTTDVPCEMTLQESNITKIRNANVVEKVKQDNGWLIRVRAVASDNPWFPSIYQSTWSVGWSIGPDNSDPDTSIIRAQDSSGRIISNGSSTQSTSIRFAYTGTDNVRVVGYNCRLDGSAPSPCPDGTKDYSELSLGNHVFQVAARDEAGNVDKTPATYTWMVREGADIPRICIVRPWLPQCDPNQQSLTTQQITPSSPSEQEAATTTAIDNQTMTEDPVQESADIPTSEAQAVTEPLTVKIIPNATQGIVPTTFQFDANITGGTEPYSIRWNIGEDRTESNEERILHTFEEAGSYDVTLTAADSNGETLSDTIEVQMLEPEEDEPLEEEGGESEEDNTADAETVEGD